MSKVLNRDTYLSKNVGNFQDTIEINGCIRMLLKM